jgi:hypothetical protein
MEGRQWMFRLKCNAGEKPATTVESQPAAQKGQG